MAGFEGLTSTSMLTSIDSLMDIVQRKKMVTVRELSEELHWGPVAIERVARLMERRGLVEGPGFHAGVVCREFRIPFFEGLIQS